MASTKMRDREKASTRVIRVNVGGEMYQDHEGHVWEADQAYHAGSWGTLDMPTTDILTTTDRISATEDQFLFQSIRVGEQLEAAKGEPVVDEEIKALVAEREQARKDRDFARADEIRDQLAAQGIILEDTAEGTIWRRR